MRRLLAAGIVLGAVLGGLGVVRAMSADAAAVPPHHPTQLAKVADSRQVIVAARSGQAAAHRDGSDGGARQGVK